MNKQECSLGLVQVVRLEEAKAVDLYILEQYKDKPAFYELTDYSKAIEAKLTDIGNDFVYLTNLREHSNNLSNIIDNYYGLHEFLDEIKNLKSEDINYQIKQNIHNVIRRYRQDMCYTPLPNQTITRNHIERVVSLKKIPEKTISYLNDLANKE